MEGGQAVLVAGNRRGLVYDRSEAHRSVYPEINFVHMLMPAKCSMATFSEHIQ